MAGICLLPEFLQGSLAHIGGLPHEEGGSWGLEVMVKFKGTWFWGEGGGGQVLAGRVRAGSPSRNWLGLRVSPFRLFSIDQSYCEESRADVESFATASRHGCGGSTWLMG